MSQKLPNMLDNTIAKIREKYGFSTVQRGVIMEDERLKSVDIRGKKEETNSKKDCE